MYQQRCWSTLGQPDHGFHQPLSEVGESHGLVKAGREILPKGDKPLAQIIAIPNHHANNHAVNSAQSANLAMSRCNKAVSRAHLDVCTSRACCVTVPCKSKQILALKQRDCFWNSYTLVFPLQVKLTSKPACVLNSRLCSLISKSCMFSFVFYSICLISICLKPENKLDHTVAGQFF